VDLDPDPYIFGPTGSGSVCVIICTDRFGSGCFHHKAKIVRQTLISTVLRLLNDFSSLKNDVNIPVPSKCKNQKKLEIFFFLLAS
jgi:hypothetical protein